MTRHSYSRRIWTDLGLGYTINLALLQLKWCAYDDLRLFIVPHLITDLNTML